MIPLIRNRPTTGPRPAGSIRVLPGIACWLLLCVPLAAQEAPQVRIEARILEWQMENGLDFDFAVQYQRLPGQNGRLEQADLTLTADPVLERAARLFFDNIEIGESGDLNAIVEVLETRGEVKVLSQPSVVLTSVEVGDDKLNELGPPGAYSATLSNNRRVPYEDLRNVATRVTSITNYRDTGVTLNVSVAKVKDGLIVLDLYTEVSQVMDFIRVATNSEGFPIQVPVIDSRLIQSRLVIPDRTPVIAGLMKTTRRTENRRGLPWLSELPILNWFLSNRNDRYEDIELVFIVQPEIVTPYRPLEVPGQ